MKEDYKNICELFYLSHYVPIAYFDKGQLTYLEGYPDISAPYDVVLNRIADFELTLDIFTDDSLGHYGIVPIPDTDVLLMIGPVFSTLVSQQIVHAYMRELTISLNQFQLVFDFLSSIPLYTYNHFGQLINFVYYMITKRRMDVLGRLLPDKNCYVDAVSKKHIENTYAVREEQVLHNTYTFEMEMMSYIRNGNPNGLKKFLLHSVGKTPSYEGTVAFTPLRQAKNIFIAMVAQVGKNAAIPGGMNIEETYQLMDVYAQECECMQTVDDIWTLRYHMLLDFASRVECSQIPEHISPDIYECVQYIKAHVNEHVFIQDVADHIHRSLVYTMTHFKKELGFSIGQYVTHAKLQEAKNLLLFTEKSLAEISSYLSFSSQAYFQNVFKKQYGMTPTQYRKNKGNDKVGNGR